MAIKTRNKISVSFNSSSMSDLVFLLLIFFMLTSTLVAPNAIKLLLPSSSSKTMAKQTVTVYINDLYQYYVEEVPVTVDGAYRYWEKRVERLRNTVRKRPTYLWEMIQNTFKLNTDQMNDYFGEQPELPPDAV